MTLSIIIPAYNEEKRLPQTLQQIAEFFQHAPPYISLHEIIVVDDGSADATEEVVRNFRERLPVTCIRLPVNRGKGAALRAGVKAASGDSVLLYDADAAAPIEEVKKLIQAMQKDKADIAIGSRVLKDLQTGTRSILSMPWHRRLIGRLYYLLSAPLVPGIIDRSCGCKLFRRSVAQHLFSLQTVDRFGYDIEILSLAAKHKYRIAEVPIAWTAVPGSKVRLLRDGMEMFVSLLRLYGRSPSTPLGVKGKKRRL